MNKPKLVFDNKHHAGYTVHPYFQKEMEFVTLEPIAHGPVQHFSNYFFKQLLSQKSIEPMQNHSEIESRVKVAFELKKNKKSSND